MVTQISDVMPSSIMIKIELYESISRSFNFYVFIIFCFFHPFLFYCEETICISNFYHSPFLLQHSPYCQTSKTYYFFQ